MWYMREREMREGIPFFFFFFYLISTLKGRISSYLYPFQVYVPTQFLL